MGLALSDDVVYAGTRGWGIFRSEDGGISWQVASAGLTSPRRTGVGGEREHVRTRGQRMEVSFVLPMEGKVGMAPANIGLTNNYAYVH